MLILLRESKLLTKDSTIQSIKKNLACLHVLSRPLPHIPGGNYSAKDSEKERELCRINFYDPKTVLCPKTWATSPAVIIQDLKPGLSVSAQESSLCGSRSLPTKAKFKSTMNGERTSGTYSPSPLLYYHFSRYFETLVNVPVAVYRTMDKDVHLSRISSKAGYGTGMNSAAWEIMRKSLADPSFYVPTDDLFTSDRKQVYGTLFKDSGERYGTEVNGVRTGGGETQNYDFQKTAYIFETLLVIFVLAWIGQFYGHTIEGKRPSFFRDVVFLLVGPLWLVETFLNSRGRSLLIK